METAADLSTRGGRVQHVRYGLALRFGNVGLARFGELVADEETRLTGETVAAYSASSVKRWEEGVSLYLNCALAIASLGGTTAEWIGLGDASKIKRRPTEEQERRTTVVRPTHTNSPGVTRKKSS